MILLPGIMGSELVDAGGDVVWGLRPSLLAREVFLGNALSRLRLPPDASDDGIRPSGLVRFPVSLPLLTGIEPYAELEQRLFRVAMRAEAVLSFPYDWRRSIEHAAGRLAAAAERHLTSWSTTWSHLPAAERRALPEPKLTLVAHSMGGLVARWFAEVLGGRDIVRQIITLGTPFAGSLKIVRALADGSYLPFGLFAASLRDTVRTFPGAHDLIAHYRCVDDRRGAGLRAIAPSDLGAIGLDPDRVAHGFAVNRRLGEAVVKAGSDACAIRPLVGQAQPTLQSVRFGDGTAHFEEHVNGIDERGDGTVYRYSAAPKGATEMPLPQTHGSLAQSDEAQTFVEAALTHRDLGEVMAPPGVGLRIPEAVRPGAPFDVELLDGSPGSVCRVTDAETNSQVAAVAFAERDGLLVASVTTPAPGLYRVSVAGGGYTPVESLLPALSR